MKYADIAGLSEGELRKKVKELRLTMFEARMKNALGQMANPMEIRVNRRDTARLKMALHMKTLGKTEGSGIAQTLKKAAAAVGLTKAPAATKAKKKSTASKGASK